MPMLGELYAENMLLKKAFRGAIHNIALEMAILDREPLGLTGLIHHNAKRLHSSIGYRPPNELEAEVLNIR